MTERPKLIQRTRTECAAENWALAVLAGGKLELYDTYQNFLFRAGNHGMTKDEAIREAAAYTVKAQEDDFGVDAFFPVPVPVTMCLF
jgi:hypothetical protein